MSIALFVALFGLSARSASATTVTFDYTGAEQEWTVPAGVDYARFDLYGAQGGSKAPAPPGLGGRATATIAVTPAASIQVNVGGQGAHIQGGFNGGGLGFVGGGGASDIRIGGTALNDRVLVAGGGGGSGYGIDSTICGNGGDGGGLVGDDGTATQTCGVHTPAPGGGGTQDHGGTASPNATAGTFGVGGTAGGAVDIGGGGGGWWGGGGGLSGGGGGGGSSFIAGYALDGSILNGVRSGDGQAVIIYQDFPAQCASVVPIYGGPGSETLEGTTETDAIDGAGGLDTLRGKAGDDCLYGGDKRDQLLGGDGDDKLSGGEGNDNILPGSGKNKVKCGPGRDRVVVTGGAKNRIAADCELVL